MLAQRAADALNHLLRQNAWARQRLQPHAGATVRLVATPWRVDLRISPLGFLTTDTAPAATDASLPAPDLTLSLPLAALPRAALSGEALASHAELAGRAELAEAIGVLLRELRWDLEDDLAPWLGDVAAHRLAQAAAHLRDHLRDASARLQGAVREFVQHEGDAVVPKTTAASRQRELMSLQRDVDALARRVDRLAPRRP